MAQIVCNDAFAPPKRHGKAAAMKSLCIIPFLCPATFAAAAYKLPDQIVNTPVGNFRVTNLICDHLFGTLFVDGRIVNETTKSWDTVWLAMEFRDKNGAIRPKQSPEPLILAGDPSASAGLVVQNVVIGKTVKFRYSLDAKADTPTFSAKFKLANGKYPVQYRIALSKSVSSEPLVFRDDALAMAFSLRQTEIGFTLQNNTDVPIKIDWNLVTFVESWGGSQGVIHKGVKLIDKQAAKPPSLIPPKARLDDMVVPVDRVEFVEGRWLIQPLLIQGPTSLKTVGQDFSIFMPLEIGTTTKNYIFTFTVVGVD
jgi:hypothetical protein